MACRGDTMQGGPPRILPFNMFWALLWLVLSLTLYISLEQPEWHVQLPTHIATTTDGEEITAATRAATEWSTSLSRGGLLRWLFVSLPSRLWRRGTLRTIHKGTIDRSNKSNICQGARPFADNDTAGTRAVAAPQSFLRDARFRYNLGLAAWYRGRRLPTRRRRQHAMAPTNGSVDGGGPSASLPRRLETAVVERFNDQLVTAVALDAMRLWHPTFGHFWTHGTTERVSPSDPVADRGDPVGSEGGFPKWRAHACDLASASVTTCAGHLASVLSVSAVPPVPASTSSAAEFWLLYNQSYAKTPALVRPLVGGGGRGRLCLIPSMRDAFRAAAETDAAAALWTRRLRWPFSFSHFVAAAHWMKRTWLTPWATLMLFGDSGGTQSDQATAAAASTAAKRLGVLRETTFLAPQLGALRPFVARPRASRASSPSAAAVAPFVVWLDSDDSVDDVAYLLEQRDGWPPPSLQRRGWQLTSNSTAANEQVMSITDVLLSTTTTILRHLAEATLRESGRGRPTGGRIPPRLTVVDGFSLLGSSTLHLAAVCRAAARRAAEGAFSSLEGDVADQQPHAQQPQSPLRLLVDTAVWGVTPFMLSPWQSKSSHLPHRATSTMAQQAPVAARRRRRRAAMGAVDLNIHVGFVFGDLATAAPPFPPLHPSNRTATTTPPLDPWDSGEPGSYVMEAWHPTLRLRERCVRASASLATMPRSPSGESSWCLSSSDDDASNNEKKKSAAHQTPNASSSTTTVTVANEGTHGSTGETFGVDARLLTKQKMKESDFLAASSVTALCVGRRKLSRAAMSHSLRSLNRGASGDQRSSKRPLWELRRAASSRWLRSTAAAENNINDTHRHQPRHGLDLPQRDVADGLDRPGGPFAPPLVYSVRQRVQLEDLVHNGKQHTPHGRGGGGDEQLPSPAEHAMVFLDFASAVGHVASSEVQAKRDLFFGGDRDQAATELKADGEVPRDAILSADDFLRCDATLNVAASAVETTLKWMSATTTRVTASGRAPPLEPHTVIVLPGIVEAILGRLEDEQPQHDGSPLRVRTTPSSVWWPYLSTRTAHFARSFASQLRRATSFTTRQGAFSGAANLTSSPSEVDERGLWVSRHCPMLRSTLTRHLVAAAGGRVVPSHSRRDTHVGTQPSTFSRRQEHRLSCAVVISRVAAHALSLAEGLEAVDGAAAGEIEGAEEALLRPPMIVPRREPSGSPLQWRPSSADAASTPPASRLSFFWPERFRNTGGGLSVELHDDHDAPWEGGDLHLPSSAVTSSSPTEGTVVGNGTTTTSGDAVGKDSIQSPSASSSFASLLIIGAASATAVVLFAAVSRNWRRKRQQMRRSSPP